MSADKLTGQARRRGGVATQAWAITWRWAMLASLLAWAGCSADDASQPGGDDTATSTHSDVNPNDTSEEADTLTSSDTSPDAEGPMCGNGVLEAGERCDLGIEQGMPGACPLTCDPGPGCVAQAPAGSGCDRHCASAPILVCDDGDGCCPAGCASATDSDCLDTCGNGALDPGESCDGDCPTSCDGPPPACAQWRLVGDPSACNVRCDMMPLALCISGDGCCPSICNDTNDSDCTITNTCGDGVLDPQELCDGNCPTICPSPDACAPVTLVGAPETCDARCEASDPISQCVGGDGCCPTGCDNDTDSDCLPPWTCAPSTPLLVGYAEIQHLQGVALRGALSDRVANHMSLGYNQARDFMFNQLDVNANGQLECPYSGRFATPDGTRTPGTFNTEHSWPQSDAAGDTTANNEPARSDLHHLFPTDATANSARGNFDFGWTDCGTPGQGACGWAMAGSKLGPQRGNPSVTVFEVRPKYRGDMARAHFYFAVRYNRPIPAAEEATLRAWHCEDPPDDVERLRNDRIGVRQGRRNPFVDRPDFVERISDF